ncbi:hypothetical protein SYNPS1DRAFT_29351 [Syncephalis pseudoplumigaleata]|uniref:IGFBP N-terminal domain-containing protein n=1 Tax=Syncephalis pseudoplumigaleata TaxID=1712513 RepID=A0A4P9YXP8_9FUNG|nr:hypothetical protein SYNPS1DRAFT_29351 [Syncephalis pseudoplumigaleata]|eukprot:RKP24903.1 hypothetical protein SYNPS1DRAFT_29351 [Syncephalis pseudoplumigaleata]
MARSILIKASLPLLMLAAAALTTEAVPYNTCSPPPADIPVVPVGLENRCGIINNVNYVCRTDQTPPLTCATMPGQTQTICLQTSQEGGPCNNQFTRCAAGLTCVIPPGQWQGRCVRPQ